ncbi:polyketide synthase PksJ [Anaerobacterium chartisolvens]|uniref:Phenolphthiocerol/phthiocerol polyketide synthase subunit E n=1 Tax=Anaerobacterium chartisolvens TaxID=1297424 RepID=A0A369AXZ0_9FIRM|nr:non-ribosomal peptide synthetase [Anaerobacterium chartisolvens]RCX14282.1 polyketide synthase PksJ [Anaerobacterium chartisolvens]
MSAHETLTELIISRKDEHEKGITFILGETNERYVSYKSLYDASLSLLYKLQKAGFKQGDQVIFQIDDNEKFVYSFWACILGAMIPVPVSPGTNDEHKMKLFKIWEVLDNPCMLASRDFMLKLEGFADKKGLQEQMASITKRTAYVEDMENGGEQGEIHSTGPDDMAFVQFSSGSTGEPKGVIITHKNVIANLSSVIKWTGINCCDTGLNWMPLTHDMGLIGTHIKGVLACMNQYNMHTQLFIRHPSLWISKASEHNVTITYSPNFGYKHFLKFFNEDVKKDWDLSGIRLIYNGAEPISAGLCNEFLDKLSGYGLRRNAMYPVYGLAEGTIAVTFPHMGDELRCVTLNREYLKIGQTVREATTEDIRAVTFVDVGLPIYDCRVRICGEDNNDLGENRIGNIQISGANVTCGYYNNPEATRQAITGDGWLNTGDLGFMRDKRLVITGRAKDVIFVAGQNFYSHDIERAAEEIEGVELGKAAAVGIFDEGLQCDRIVMFILFKQKAESFMPLSADIKRCIGEKTGIEVSDVIPIKSMPKTTSGKIQRYKLRESFLNGEYDAIRAELNSLMDSDIRNRVIEPPKNDTEKRLVEVWCDILGYSRVGTRDSFFDLGGDSLKITRVISRIRDLFDVELTQSEFFENPCIEALACIIDGAGKNKSGGSESIKTFLPDTGRLPLSFGQKRLWFLDRLNSESPQYNLYTALRLKGSLRADLMEKSVCMVIQRHKILSSSFYEEDGTPVQLLNKEYEFRLDMDDISHMPPDERQNKAMELAEDVASRPFRLDTPPLVRGRLIRLSEDEHLLVLAVHHIIFDGWSFGILLKELSQYYEAALEGKDAKLADLDIQYADFARWQLQRAEGEETKQQLEFWKTKLSGELPVLELPIIKNRPAIQQYTGAKLTASIPGSMVKKLQVLARRENCTLFMLLLAAFKLLLYRYTGQQDIIVGSPVANRNRKEIEGLIGFFVNNMVLRTSFSAGDKFSELLSRVKKVTLEAYANQDIPFEKLVEELNIQRDMSRNPLFQILFSLQNTPSQGHVFSEMNISTMDMDSGFARFDLCVDVRDAGDSLAVDFEYNTSLFNTEDIARMAGHYKQLLKGICASPDEYLDGYEILTQPEELMQIEQWNRTELDLGDVKCWVQLFDMQAERSPEALAVISRDGSMTYRELSSRSNKLANYLIESGAGRETVVGVYMDRTPQMLVALLGIHKAGAAYLPMDPIFPSERIAYMLEDAQTGIVLTQEALADTLPDHNAKIICLDREWQAIDMHYPEVNVCKGERESLAYLIYTSGSTGKPKGVQIEQYALLNFLVSTAQKTGLKDRDKLLAVTTLSFDIAGLELFMPLIAGASVVLAARDDTSDGSRLTELMDKHRITIMQATPATWRIILQSGWKGSKTLRILCGGEALPEELAFKLADRCGCLWNMYGPTETTIWSSMEQIASGHAVTIGKPIGNTKVYILNPMMRHMPVGIPGELYIGGDGLARGYLNQPELTRERFVPNPFVNALGARIYKTGDLVRFLKDGRMEFVGRLDHQVKIRGFRIELGEIESLLCQSPSVKQSVVAAREVIPGEKSLVAYIVPHSGYDAGSLDASLLRKLLKEKLPDYMIPSAFVVMESFPMTPNRKIDRKALPMPKSLGSLSEEEYEAPSNETEKQIADIWRDVLKRDAVGVNDNFFDLGGHSLLLAQVRSRVEKLLGRDIPMLELFKYPTVHTLAQYLDGKSRTAINVPSANAAEAKETEGQDIAVIGLSGRFPGAANIDEFWSNLERGVESISRFTDEEVIEEGVDPDMLDRPEYVKAWGILDGVDKFDALFFGYNPREAAVLDPQQRIFLEESWRALENSGYDSEKYNGSIGVFASTGMNTYIKNLSGGEGSEGLANDYQIMISNDKDFLATRVAYKLNLEGPGMTVQTACSSSLVAVHLACRSLNSGECDMALAGGVSVRLPQKKGYMYQEGMILSPDGHCRAFDEKAKGTVGGNGAGVVVLKRLDKAVRDRDNIWAVIKGSAINNDGSMKVGYTAPRLDGQARVIHEAQRKAGIDPATITYIEAHGTGTPMGDPIEIEALKQVFGTYTDKRNFCAVGSVKTNIGHLDSASGVTGLIKTVLSLNKGKIPPSVNFYKPNPKIDFENSPFFVNAALAEWKSGEDPRRAGVSSFGIGGTNAHAVLEEAPKAQPDAAGDGEYLIVLSAKTGTALDAMSKELAEFLSSNEGISMADAAYTLQVGRREHEIRRFLVCASREDAIEILSNMSAGSKRAFDNKDNKGTYGTETIRNTQGDSLEELGHRWLAEEGIDWEKLYEGQKRRRIPLPSYPFEGKSYWTSAPMKNTRQNINAKKKKDIDEWFYTPVWKQSVRDVPYSSSTAVTDGRSMLILAEEGSFTERLTELLALKGDGIIIASAASEYKKISENTYQFNPNSPADYKSLLHEAGNSGGKGCIVVNLMGVTGDADGCGDENYIECGERLFYSMLYTAQAYGELGWKCPVDIKLISDHPGDELGGRRICTGKAMSMGPCRVIPIEYPAIKCSDIGFVMPRKDSRYLDEMLKQLAAEIYSETKEAQVDYRGTERWELAYERVPLHGNNGDAIALKPKGVYLITGGLGGIGLALAEHLAQEAKARLVLVARSQFIEREKWEDWLQSKGPEDKVSKVIQRLTACIGKGADLLICSADITSPEALRDVRRQAQQKFGSIDGIFHAAGIPGGGMIQIKKREFAEKVLAPKVRGTVAIHDAFKDEKPDFFIFYSSLNALTGGFGQADYSAANAFMDAFARQNDSHYGTRVISINWDRWPGTGMAAATSSKPQSLHPLLGDRLAHSEQKTVYMTQMSPESHWVLSEHLVLGTPTIAGTTYIEMARAAFEEIEGGVRSRIADVIFLSPMAVAAGEKRDVFTILGKSGSAYSFQIVSRSHASKGGTNGWQEHVRGTVCRLEEENSGVQDDLSQISSRCRRDIMPESERNKAASEEFISFGRRWKNLKSFDMGNDEALVQIELDEEFEGDMASYRFHPAVADAATGSVRLAAGGSYLPFSYGRLDINAAIPRKIYAHIRFKNGYGKSEEIITSDISIMNDKGLRLVEITGFSMKLIGEAAAEGIKSRAAAAQNSDFAELERLCREDKRRRNKSFDEGISVSEGNEVLKRIFKGCFKYQVVVSTRDIQEAFRQADYTNRAGAAEGITAAAPAQQLHPRPELDNEFIPAKSDTEKKLAEIWQRILGIDRIGVLDEFFALGGDSLLLIQLHSKLKESFETDIAVVDLYKYNTVSSLSKYLSAGSQEQEKPVFTQVNQRAEKQLELLKQKRQRMIRK